MKNEKEIEITVEKDIWQKALDEAFNKKKKDIKVEGFRKGNVPKDIFLKKVGIEVLYESAIDIVYPNAVKEAKEKTGIEPVIPPTIDITNIGQDGVTIKFILTGKPEVTLGDYKNLKIKKDKVSVSSEEIDTEIKNLQKQLTEITPKEKGGIEKGNIAIIDFEGIMDGEKFEGGSAENYELEVGSNTFIPGFEDGLIGLNIGDKKDLELKFPEDYHENLKGKDVTFKVVVKDIKEKVIPELNEEFYLDLGYENMKTEEDFRKEVESVLKERKETEIENIHLEKCLEKACENMQIELSEKLIDEEVHRLIHNISHNLESQGIKMDDYLKFTGATHETLHKELEPEAVKRLKERYLLEKIAEVEKIDFKDKEVEEQANEMASNYGITVKELINAYGSLDVVKYDMKMHRAMEIIKENN